MAAVECQHPHYFTKLYCCHIQKSSLQKHLKSYNKSQSENLPNNGKEATVNKLLDGSMYPS